MKSMVKFLCTTSFFCILGLSVIGGVSQTSLFSSWVMLELNMLTFVAALSLTKAALELAGMKYFIVQSIGSSMFLGSASLSLFHMSHEVMASLMGFSLLLKLGVAPMHGWFVSVLSALNWEFLVLASTLQKVLPLFLTSLLMLKFMWAILGASILISVSGSFNQLNTKKLLAYSSVFSAVWMLSCGPVFDVLMQYLGAYSVALAILASLFSLENCTNVNEFLYQAEKGSVIILMIGFFSMGGSPPFLGFYAKIIVAQVLLSQAQMILLSFMVMSSVFLLYVYMRFFYFSISGLSVVTEQSTIVNSKLGVFSMAIFFLLGLPWLLRNGVWHSKFWTFSN